MSSLMTGRLVKHYRLLKELARGSTAVIHLGMDVHTKKLYAIKEMNLLRQQRQAYQAMLYARHPKNAAKRRRLSIDQAPLRSMGESDILQSLENDKIIRWIDEFEDENSYYLVTEWVKGSVLVDLHRAEPKPLDLASCKSLFLQLVDALSYVHNQGIIHGDIKPDNILVNKKQQVKLIDFGSAFRVRRGSISSQGPTTMTTATATATSNRCGTPAFTAPEFASHLMQDKTIEKRAAAIDIWALGMTLYCMVFGKLPFEQVPLTSSLLYHQLVASLVTTSAGNSIDVHPQLLDLLSKMLRLDPCERLTLDQIKQHPWCATS
ncbi:kinase-like domain-containing protein [Gongronella butleri]|nr:kinase-like domain-containing protein [Gongronella butleri]